MAEKKVAAVCRNCKRELKIHHADDAKEAVKRNRWSNLNFDTKPISGICRPCGKKGLR